MARKKAWIEITQLATEPAVQLISPDTIKRNRENPRVVFKTKDMQTLLDSIDKRGVIVPLIVYPGDGHFTLLDGERRLICARRLNLNSVPVNIIAKPNKVQNILHMFHIHNVRQAWELIETAQKLKVLLGDETFKDRSPKEIAELAGLSTSTVNRCKQLLSLDPSYQQMILENYQRAEKGQEIEEGKKLTEDFFIEAKRAISSIKRFQKDVAAAYSDEEMLDRFVRKRRSGTFSNVIEIGRQIPKIIAAGRKGGSERKVARTLKRLLDDPDYTIQEAYKSSAEPILVTIGIEKRSAALIDELKQLQGYPRKQLEGRKDELIKALKQLQVVIKNTISELQ